MLDYIKINNILVKNSSHPLYKKPIGEILIEADLISIAQVNVALKDQMYSHNMCSMRLGEILAMRGWIQQETADFFALDWFNLIQQHPKKLLGWYLKKAKLLEEKDINNILEKQEIVKIRFGTVAVLEGYFEKTTLDFFLKYLFPEKFNISPIRYM